MTTSDISEMSVENQMKPKVSINGTLRVTNSGLALRHQPQTLVVVVLVGFVLGHDGSSSCGCRLLCVLQMDEWMLRKYHTVPIQRHI